MQNQRGVCVSVTGGDNTVHAFVCVLGWVAHTCVRVCHLSLDKCWTVGGVGGGSGE